MSFNDRSTDIQGDGRKISIAPDGMVSFQQDKNMNVRFYNKSVPCPILSAQYGRPMEKKVPYVFLQHPGERDYSDDPIANKPGVEQRFPHQYEQYLKSAEQAPPGTPIEILFPTNPEISANLHGFAVHTVEQLADLTEHAAQSIGMGVTQWRNAAKDFLNKANAHVGIHQWNKEKTDLTNKIEVLENQLALQKTQIDRLLAQLQQGVPAAMIPTGVPPQAQAHAATVQSTPMTDWTAQYATVNTVPQHQHVYTPDPGGNPSPAGQVQSSGAQISPTPPQALGRPRGRPRKTPIPTAEGTS